MTRAELLRYFPNASRSTFARNGVALLGGLEDPKRKRDQRGQSQNPIVGPSQARVESRICVTIISLRRRLVDAHDNLRQGAKPLVDAITTSLGLVSDGDARLTWQYVQEKTAGREGTAVIIERTWKTNQ